MRVTLGNNSYSFDDNFEQFRRIANDGNLTKTFNADF